ncbi:MAG: matrixin family metalloprotease [Candidatus Krumholzibacteria bacterium]|nr:matrixin family metalloprotease [Candidatus Krumholzibacteria bacterium]
MRWFTVPVVGVALMGLACDEDATRPPSEVQTRNAPPAIVSYLPADTLVEGFVGVPLDFSLQAADPDGDDLHFRFFLDDSLVSNESEWRYVVADVGPCRVRGEVSDGEHELALTWRMTRYVAEGDPIEIVSFTSTAAPDVSIVRWIAGRDSRGNPLQTYWVRTALGPIATEYAWTLGRTYEPVTGAPAPGDTVTMLLHDLAPLKTHYIAVRGVDSRFEYTRLGASPSLLTAGMSLTGVVIALPDGTTAPGVTVRLSAHETVAGVDGRFALRDLPSITASLIASDDGVAPGVGAYYDYAVLYTTVWIDSVELYLLRDQPVGAAGYYPSFLVMYRHLTDVGGIPVPSHTRRWEPPIALYVPPFAYGGLDYRATIVAVAGEINATIGLTLLTIVDDAPAVGVTVVYSAQATADRFIMRERTPDWYPRRGEVTFRTRYQEGDRVEFRRIARHELGHALGLGHSNAPVHLMYPLFPTQEDFHADEVAVIRSHYGMPRGLDMTRFLND